MRYAQIGDDDRVEATPRARARCPLCAAEVTAKCGRLVAPHWAHVAREDCDEWAEADSAWHRAWQDCVPAGNREVVLGRHRADILTPTGTVVELQHSSIPTEQIIAREEFYGHRMIWIFDAAEAYESNRLNLRNRKDYVSFRWKHPRKTIGVCRRPVYLDLGNGAVLHVRKFHPEAPSGGWGHLGYKTELQAWMASSGFDFAAAFEVAS